MERTLSENLKHETLMVWNFLLLLLAYLSIKIGENDQNPRTSNNKSNFEELRQYKKVLKIVLKEFKTSGYKGTQ